RRRESWRRTQATKNELKSRRQNLISAAQAAREKVARRETSGTRLREILFRAEDAERNCLSASSTRHTFPLSEPDASTSGYLLFAPSAQCAIFKYALSFY